MTSRNRESKKVLLQYGEGKNLRIFVNKMNTLEQQFSNIFATPDLIAYVAPLKLE